MRYHSLILNERSDANFMLYDFGDEKFETIEEALDWLSKTSLNDCRIYDCKNHKFYNHSQLKNIMDIKFTNWIKEGF